MADLAIVPGREAFLAERRKGIGGSDCAAIVGEDPKVTRYQLWREKVGIVDPDTGKPFARRRGNFLEPAILRRYAETVQPTQLEVGIPHGGDSWRRGNQDARATMANGTRRVVEAKSVNRNVFRSAWGAPWSDEVPRRALCQGLWYGDLDSADVVDFAVCVIPDDPDEVLGLTADQVVAASEFHVFQAARNATVEHWLAEEAAKFWFDHVVAQVPPEAVSEEDAELRWPIAIDGKAMPAAPVFDLLRRYQRVSEAWNTLKHMREAMRERLLLHAQGAAALVAPDGRTPWLTISTQTRAAHAVAESTARVLRTTKWLKTAKKPTTPNPEN